VPPARLSHGDGDEISKTWHCRRAGIFVGVVQTITTEWVGTVACPVEEATMANHAVAIAVTALDTVPSSSLRASRCLRVLRAWRGL
jgi:hypothetical protein